MHLCRAEPRAPRHAGFALVTILLLAGIAGLLAVAALRDARFAQALVNTQQFQQRAFVLAQSGLADGVSRLRSDEPATDGDWALASATPDQVDVSLRRTGISHLPPGYSLARFTAYHVELQGSARTAAQARAVHAQGAVQLVPKPSSAEPGEGCLGATSIPLRVAIEPGSAPVQAELRGAAAPPLRVVDPLTGSTLWSAGATGAYTQRHAAMQAGFAGSLSALDLDGDGVHDRLYAGDLAGRIWRIDLHHGAGAAGWASAGVFADLGAGGARAFVAPPDLSLSAPPGEQPWINIAVGTIANDPLHADNHFHVLRDHAVFEDWNAAPQRNEAGSHLPLGAAQIVTASLTVDGRITVAVSDPGPITAPDCRSEASVHTLDLATGAPDPRHAAVPVTLRGAPAFELQPHGDGSARCLLGGTSIPACDLRDPVRLTWWRTGEHD